MYSMIVRILVTWEKRVQTRRVREREKLAENETSNEKKKKKKRVDLLV
jgi:hypothetical protein